MPAAVRVVEANSVLALFAKPQWFVHADPDSLEPRVARSFISKEEDDIDLFEGAESRFGVKEVDKGYDSEICYGKYDPGAIANVGEGDRGDDDDTSSESVI